MIAFMHANVDCVELLLSDDVNIDATDYNSRTALMQPSEHGTSASVEILLYHRAMQREC